MKEVLLNLPMRKPLEKVERHFEICLVKGSIRNATFLHAWLHLDMTELRFCLD